MMFYKGEVEAEIREVPSQRFHSDSDFDLYMQHVEEQRVSSIYPHNSSSECRSKGMPMHPDLVAKIL